MTRARRPRRTAQPGGRGVPRTARLNELLREVIAEELERIEDDRLVHLALGFIAFSKPVNGAKYQRRPHPQRRTDLGFKLFVITRRWMVGKSDW